MREPASCGCLIPHVGKASHLYLYVHCFISQPNPDHTVLIIAALKRLLPFAFADNQGNTDNSCCKAKLDTHIAKYFG